MNNTFCARSLWGEASFVHGTGGMRRRVGHSREGSHVLEGISRCQNLQGRAHTCRSRQRRAGEGVYGWISIKTSSRPYSSYDTAVTRVIIAQLSGCRTDGVTVVQNNDVWCVDVCLARCAVVNSNSGSTNTKKQARTNTTAATVARV